VKFIVEGGEKHEVTGHSFVAEANYETALGRESTRVVSCNTTSIVRTLTALKRAGLLRRARGTLLRRATDPWESHEGGIMNTLVPERDIPSHQGPDAQTVDPELDVVTMAVKVPETIAHLHYWSVELERAATKDDVLAAFRASSRVALVNMDSGLSALNAIKELVTDLGRPHDNLYEVACGRTCCSASAAVRNPMHSRHTVRTLSLAVCRAGSSMLLGAVSGRSVIPWANCARSRLLLRHRASQRWGRLRKRSRRIRGHGRSRMKVSTPPSKASVKRSSPWAMDISPPAVPVRMPPLTVSDTPERTWPGATIAW
jgi:hypothetical protein